MNNRLNLKSSLHLEMVDSPFNPIQMISADDYSEDETPLHDNLINFDHDENDNDDFKYKNLT